jgi:hypothetical protein
MWNRNAALTWYSRAERSSAEPVRLRAINRTPAKQSPRMSLEGVLFIPTLMAVRPEVRRFDA